MRLLSPLTELENLVAGVQRARIDTEEGHPEEEKPVSPIQQQYQSGLVTAGERYNKVVDIRSRTNERVAAEMMKGIGSTRSRMRRASRSKRSR